MKKIEMGKKYTWRGHVGLVRYTDGKLPGLPVGVELESGHVINCDEYGRTQLGYQLIEVSPYADIPIDTPGWVRDATGWLKRHFAGVDEYGHPMAWGGGGTSFTTERKTSWYEFTTAKPEGVE